jgi:hypothetical protein
MRFGHVLLAFVLIAVAGCGAMGDRYGSTDGFPATGAAPWYKVDLDPDQDLVQPYVLLGDAEHYLVEPSYILSDSHYLFYEVDTIDVTSGLISDSVIMFATSDDGVDWTIANDAQPVMIADLPWEAGGVGGPTVFEQDGSFVMYYAAGNGAGIGRAESADGIVWEKEGAPVLVADQAWEGSVVGAPAAFLHGGKVHLYYSGGDLDGPDLARRCGTAIGFAQSGNGTAFTKRDAADHAAAAGAVQPVLEATQEWEDTRYGFGMICSPDARVDRPVERDIFRLYYTGNLVGDFVLNNVGIGTAGGFDAVNFEKMDPVNNPIINERFPLTLFGAEQYIVYGEFSPSVVKNGNSYRMVFAQTDLLESKQGLALAVHPRPDSF